ncbi:MAG: arsenite methyltransferase [Chloroflexi bacterium]|nr:arsenite methyltransferase [Chloroflexota bacterium]
MNDPQSIKEAVRSRYAQRAQEARKNGARCCGSDVITRDLYAPQEVAFIPANAAVFSLGCGNPTALTELRPGEVVLDLGSGAGLDVLLSARRVGPTGKAYGLDMTDEMLELARQNQRLAGVPNAEFIKGEMENIPLPDATVDVIISNCVVNLSPDKDRVLCEAYRVLKPGGRMAISDIVIRGDIPEALRRDLEAWAGCVAGALSDMEYEAKLRAAGFEDFSMETVRSYTLSDMEDKSCWKCLAELALEERERVVSRFTSSFVRACKPGGR